MKRVKWIDRFIQEDKLKTTSARLDELNILLNTDQKNELMMENRTRLLMRKYMKQEI